MAATTTDINTPRRGTEQVNVGLAADTTIPAGVLVALNSSGYAVNGANTAGLRVIGMSTAYKANTADGNAAGDETLEVSRGCHRYANSGTNVCTIADIGKPAYVEDNQTVGNAPGSGAVIAGIIHQVDSDGVWIDHSIPVADDAAGLYVAVANAGTPDGDAYVTIQSALKARQVVRCWFAATAYAAPADLGTLTATTGTILKEDTDDALATVLTDANGLAVLNLDLAVDGTVHVMVERSGICATDSEAITGN